MVDNPSQEINFVLGNTSTDRSADTEESVEEATVDSWVVSLDIGNVNGVGKRGQIYVVIDIFPRGQNVLSGYIYAGFAPSLGHKEGPVGGPGFMVTNFDAASSQTSTFTVPADARWRIHGAWAENRTQANTKVAVSVQDGSNNVYIREMIDTESDGSDDLNTTGGGRLKGLELPEGHDVLVKVVTFTASDDTEKGLLIEEWIEP